MALFSVNRGNVVRLALVVLLLALTVVLPGQQVSNNATPHHGWYGVGKEEGTVVAPPGTGVFVTPFVAAFV
jgi:hypothetical protein